MKETVSFITGLFSGLDLRRRWVAGIVLAILLLTALWIFESYAGYFFYQTMDRRIGILERMYSLEDKSVEKDSHLYPIYQSTVEQFATRTDFHVRLPTLSRSDPTSLGKAISGSFVWLIILVVGIASDIRKDKKISNTTIAMTLIIILIAYFFGWIGTIIPTLGNPWVNYVTFPLAQFILLWLLTRRHDN
jgi:hypothetical protein